MSDQCVGEIRAFAGNFAPVGWAKCDGQLMSISENEVLYTLIGTTYGGDGVTTFGLPDLRGRIPIHTSSQYPLGQSIGTEQVTLTINQLAAHSHLVAASSTDGNTASPQNSTWAKSSIKQFSNAAVNDEMSANSIQFVGGGLPHNNMMPFITVNYIIALTGIFPSQQ
ncbi:phage tail protein [Paenibacillus sp. L3-i20]|uniref:phage tail protein n=1 Tax=Paenibacillus sp. L3-i20 TaxID=2905833 RepID=UPI001EDD7DB8|nr:tail fiber protein [Paenibacillus sp. L3-i20]GKU78212.1 microcystin dependent MdpB family protein [Paenibacillus sp. L3-i20]